MARPWPRQRHGAAHAARFSSPWALCALAIAGAPLAQGLVASNTAKDILQEHGTPGNKKDGPGWLPYLEYEVGNELFRRSVAIRKEIQSAASQTVGALVKPLSPETMLDSGSFLPLEDAVNSANATMNRLTEAVKEDVMLTMTRINSVAQRAAQCSAGQQPIAECHTLRGKVDEVGAAVTRINETLYALGTINALTFLQLREELKSSMETSCGERGVSGVANADIVLQACSFMQESARDMDDLWHKAEGHIAQHLKRSQLALPFLQQAQVLLSRSLERPFMARLPDAQEAAGSTATTAAGSTTTTAT